MQTELAEHLDMPKQTVNKILHGRRNIVTCIPGTEFLFAPYQNNKKSFVS